MGNTKSSVDNQYEGKTSIIANSKFKDNFYLGCEKNGCDPELCKPPPGCPDLRPIGEIIFDKMKNMGDKIAQIDDDTGTTLTYSEILSKSIRTAQALIAKGITHKEIVAVCSVNNQYCCIPFIASVLLGIPIIPLDPHLALRDILPLATTIRPRIVFCDIGGEELMEKVIKQTGVEMEIVSFYNTRKHTPFSDFQIEREPEQNFTPRHVKDLRETLIILLTSGTTGTAKGVCTSHISWLGKLESYFGLPPTVQWGLTRMYWLIGTLVVFGSIITEGCWVMSSNFEIDNIAKVIEMHKVNLLISAPYYAHLLIEYAKNNKVNFSSLHYYAIGGNPMGYDRIKQLNNILPNMIIDYFYGTTETNGAIIRFDPIKDIKLRESKKGSLGVLKPGNCVKVVDQENGKTLGPDQIGELRVKSNWIMNKYYNKPKDTADSFDDEGYYKTGDLVYYDRDYCFYFVERIKDFIKYGGVAIFSVELEEELMTHPDVLEAVVVGIPAGEVGDHTTGIVVLRKGSKTTEEDLVNYIAERVTEKKRLHGGVKFIDEIPRTISFKSKRRVLREMITSGQL